MSEFFAIVERTMLAKYEQTRLIRHDGDVGQNREEILREFLKQHLPSRYGVVKGEVVTRTGDHSHAADVIIYDSLECPVLYSGDTAVLPIEGVYGVIEVKSRLSKQKLLEATKQIESFKRLAPRDLSVIKTREYVTVHRPPRPFGIILAYDLEENSLHSLRENVSDEHKRIHDVNYYTNLVCVLGEGLVHYQRADVEIGQMAPLLDTDEFVELVLTAEKRVRQSEPPPGVFISLIIDEAGDRTFGRFFVYLLVMLGVMKLAAPDLGPYVDPDSPPRIIRES